MSLALNDLEYSFSKTGGAVNGHLAHLLTSGHVKDTHGLGGICDCALLVGWTSLCSATPLRSLMPCWTWHSVGWSQEGYIWIPDLPLPTSVALSMALALFRSQFLICKMGLTCKLV